MAELISKAELEEIKKLLSLSHLEIIVRHIWGSEHPEYRDQIHGELKKRMAQAYPLSDASISHCRSLGGFAFTQYDTNESVSIGFDIEENERVSEEVARRICLTPEEFEKAPSPVSLWAAKEAAFKSLKGPRQPQVVSELEITDWNVTASQIETAAVFDCRKFSSSQIHGVLLRKPKHTFAFFISRP